MPAASATGSTSAGSASQPPIGVTTTSAISIEAPRPSIPLDALALRDPVAEDDVRGEEDGVRERERDADRLALELDVGEQVDAADGERERGGVPRVRAPSAASAITGRNSIAATVPSGSRSIAR